MNTRAVWLLAWSCCLTSCGPDARTPGTTQSQPVAPVVVAEYAGSADYVAGVPDAGWSDTRTVPLTVQITEMDGERSLVILQPPWFLAPSWKVSDVPPDGVAFSKPARIGDLCVWKWTGQGTGIVTLIHARLELTGVLVSEACPDETVDALLPFTVQFTGEVVMH